MNKNRITYLLNLFLPAVVFSAIAGTLTAVIIFSAVCGGSDMTEHISDIALMMFAISQFARGVFKRYKASRFITKSDTNNEINICYQDIVEADISGVTPSKQSDVSTVTGP